MRRREFFTLVGGGIAAWSPLAYAQPQNLPLIAFLSSRSSEDSKPHLAGFLRGLEALGYVDGKNVRIEYRWANGQYDRLPKLAGELVEVHPTVIAAGGGSPSARAAKSATTSVPIFFVTSDAVDEGIVASLSRPDGNITGVDIMSGELTGKRLELLSQIVQSGSVIAFLTNPKGIQTGLRIKEIEHAAQASSRQSTIVAASSDTELDASISTLAKNRVGGLVVQNDPFFDSRRDRLIQLTAQRSIPAIYHIREFPLAGGLMSYGASLVEAYYQMGVQVGRVLKGANITDLPVVRPTKFELALNLKTAKRLGLTVPPTVLAITDEIIDE